MKVACGQCTGCRLELSRQWGVRCYHEAQLYEDNVFITLTFNQENLPKDWGLDHDYWALFMKRLRKARGPGIRFLMCGEYGEVCRDCMLSAKFCKCASFDAMPGRPHFHGVMFNLDFKDRVLWKIQNDFPLFISDELSELWGLGFCSLGAVTFQSSAYVARYSLKKIRGRNAAKHYRWINKKTGEIHDRKPEYLQPSRGGRTGKGGLGREWIDKYQQEVWPDDYVVVNNAKMRPPRFYEKILEVDDPALFEKVKRQRQVNNLAHAENQTPERLAVREEVQEAKANLLRRNTD